MEKKNLKTSPLIPSDVLSHKKGWRYGYYKFHQRLANWAQEEDRERLKVIHGEWLENLICFYGEWSIHRQLTPDIRSIVSVDIFIELNRTHYRIMKSKVYEEKRELENSLFTIHPEHNMHLYAMCHTSHFSHGFQQELLDWKKPILQYGQGDIMNGLLMLTEKIDQLSVESIKETQKVLELLYTRNGMFIEEENMICDAIGFVHENGKHPNRDYFTFCAFYFHAVQRRLYYADLIPCKIQRPHGLPEGSIERCKAWVETTLCGNIEGEVYEKTYYKSCNEGYVFPGDLEWFTYRYPDLPQDQIAPILECFRKGMAKKYFSEFRISLQTLLASVDQDTHTGHCARLFLINIIDDYMKNHLDFKWKNVVVIDNEMIERSTEDMIYEEQLEAPLLIQQFSRYCVYNDSGIYTCDNFYETLTIWFYLIKKKKRFEKLIERIIDGIVPIPVFTGIF